MIIEDWEPIQDAVEAILDNPHLYDQRSYRSDLPYGCGTARCVAGWVAHLNGWADSRGDVLVERVDQDGFIVRTDPGAAALQTMGVSGLDYGVVHGMLFAGHLKWHEVCWSLRALAAADGIALRERVGAEVAEQAAHAETLMTEDKFHWMYRAMTALIGALPEPDEEKL